MKVAPSFCESDYLRRLKQSDERAFDALFRHYSALVYRFAYSHLKAGPLAEKVVQECFAKIWKIRAQLRDDVQLKDYLFLLTHRAVLDVLGRHQQPQSPNPR